MAVARCEPNDMRAQPQILVVDDDPNIVGLLALVLRQEGYAVRPATSGGECLESARQHRPNLILLDVVLPDLSGVEVCRQIKTDPALDGIFVILISGHRTDAESLASGLEGGADEYLPKPIHQRELVARVRAALRAQQATEGLRLAHEKLELRVQERTRQLVQVNTELRAEVEERKRSEAALRESEDRFAAFMKNTSASAWIKDETLRYVYVNTAGEQALGLAQPAILGKTDFDFWPEPVAVEIRANDEAVLASGNPLAIYQTVPDRHGQVHYRRVFKFRFQDARGRKYVGGVAMDITERKQAEEILRALPKSIFEAQENERRRVARELHDGVSQLLASIRFRLQAFDGKIFAGDPQLEAELTKVKQLLETTQDEVRRIAHDLRPSVLDDLGLLPAMHSACDEFQHRTGVALELDCAPILVRLAPVVELNLYRILQEALNNAAHHARAARVAVSLKTEEAFVELRIQDDGVGFETGVARRRTGGRSGFGLVDMRERAALVGGTLTVHSEPNRGTEIIARIPRPGRSEQTRPAPDLAEEPEPPTPTGPSASPGRVTA